MQLPKMTHLQFLVVGLLFRGAKSGPEIRKELEALGVRRSPAAFCNLMRRLECEVYLEGSYRTGRIGGQVVRRRRYAVTDFGVMTWNATRQFYRQVPPPPPDLVPIATENAELAGCAPRTRKAIVRRRLAKQYPDLFRRERRR